MDYIEELNSAIAEGRRRAAQVAVEVGNLDEQVLSPNERRRKQDLIDTARGKVAQLYTALTAAHAANREMERFEPTYVKFQAVSKRLTDMLTGESKDAQDVERTRVKEAKKRIDGAVRSVRSLLDEMLTVQAAA